MKITVAYLPEEKEEAAAVQAALQPLLNWEKIHKSNSHPPFKHIYMATRKPETPCNSKKNA